MNDIKEPAVQIQAEGLSKYYGKFAAAEDVSFSVKPGDITAFLGPNGAGKTTIMKILTGYIAPSNGKAFVAGYDISVDRIKASEVLGYLPENGPLYPDMTPASFLKFVARTRGLKGGELTAALDKVVDSCFIKEVWHKTINKLSKGFRQRVGLASAILHDPKVLIMDEPASGLDPNQIQLLRQLIRDLSKDKTILLSTHILQEVDAIADKVILINEGKIKFDGTPKELSGDKGLEASFHDMTGGASQ